MTNDVSPVLLLNTFVPKLVRVFGNSRTLNLDTFTVEKAKAKLEKLMSKGKSKGTKKEVIDETEEDYFVLSIRRDLILMQYQLIYRILNL
jgi:hypothetical protein